MKKLLLISFALFSIVSIYGQYGYRDSNRIGITAGVNQASMKTTNFQTKAETGWNAGLSMRGNFYNDWDMVYSMQFSESNFSVDTKYNGIIEEDVKYKLPSAQISLQLSYVILENHLSFEFGPIVQFNGKLKLDAEKENNTISGTTLRAGDIVDISKFNVYPTVGITAGGTHLRFNVSYQYGMMNTFSNLNSKSLGYNFKGNPGVINGNVIIYL
ncbi:outer membrane beta-barrel protein [Flavobacterium faecale]|uniref:outer membrane beta-barrel protein n=1 Tax=Flavobacterium faecale TaxID=1355330 RepID=UPI003AAF65EC